MVSLSQNPNQASIYLVDALFTMKSVLYYIFLDFSKFSNSKATLKVSGLRTFLISLQ